MANAQSVTGRTSSEHMAASDDAGRLGAPGGQFAEQSLGAPGVAGVAGATNFVLFDFRALTAFDERQPHVVTLSETGTARLLLVMLRAGQTLAPQQMASETSMQALRGRLRLSVGAAPMGSFTELRAGRLAQIEAQTRYRLDALSDAVVLLSLTPSPGEAALDVALRGAAGPLVMRS
jgi:quercetin dioxygenase-like cupin family protein